jgi:hypothetical protein
VVAEPWFRVNGTVDMANVGRFIGSCKDKAIIRSLVLLRDMLALPETQRVEVSGDHLQGWVAVPDLLSGAALLVQELLDCESAGIMCVTAAAHPSLYLETDQDKYLLPPEALELDMRGKIELPLPRPDVAYVHIGEVKRSLELGPAVEQLGLRLGVFRWLILNTQPVDPQIRITLVGRLFTTRGMGTSEEQVTMVPPDVMERARTKWGFSLYVHTF